MVEVPYVGLLVVFALWYFAGILMGRYLEGNRAD